MTRAAEDVAGSADLLVRRELRALRDGLPPAPAAVRGERSSALSGRQANVDHHVLD
jgi:hypothetical protein